ncbi:MAG: hypothetical protein MUP16_03295 [Sedimentisphaerales bacterium]|nr:hypothetical protein [Sedimentisphaerales bacterium]
MNNLCVLPAPLASRAYLNEAGQDEPHTQKPNPDPPVKLISQVKTRIHCPRNINPRTESPPEQIDEGQHRIIAAY